MRALNAVLVASASEEHLTRCHFFHTTAREHRDFVTPLHASVAICHTAARERRVFVTPAALSFCHTAARKRRFFVTPPRGIVDRGPMPAPHRCVEALTTVGRVMFVPRRHQTVMIRRRKAEVAAQLPPKRRQVSHFLTQEAWGIFSRWTNQTPSEVPHFLRARTCRALVAL